MNLAPDADRILVVDQGRIVETGRHEELLARGGAYSRLHRSQNNATMDTAELRLPLFAEATGGTPGGQVEYAGGGPAGQRSGRPAPGPYVPYPFPGATPGSVPDQLPDGRPLFRDETSRHGS